MGKLSAASVAASLCVVTFAAIGHSPASAAGSLAVVPALQADTLADSYGVNIHLGFLNTPYADPTSVGNALKSLGVRHVRDTLVIGSTGPREYAAIKSVNQASGAKFDLIMGRPDAGPSAADFVSTVATQLPAGPVESLEGVNEWDKYGPQAQAGSGQAAPWIAQMKSWQQGLYTAAKATPATASLPVLSPSIAFFASDYASAGDLSANADVPNLHEYPGGYRPSNLLTQALAYLHGSINTATPVVTTETGYHDATASSLGGVPEAVAGVYAPRILLEHAHTKLESRVYSYELVDEFADAGATNPEAEYGLLHRDFTPKPAFTAIKNLLALVNDPGPAFTPAPLRAGTTGMPSDGRYLLYQKRNGSYVLLLWRDVDVFNPATQQSLTVTPANVTLNLAKAYALSVYNPSVSASPASTVTGSSVTVPLDGQVTAITITPTS